MPGCHPTRSALCLALCLAPGLMSGSALADPLPKVETTFADGSVLRFYGQINKGFLTYDDGQESVTYNLIDNDTSDTRVGLTYSANLADEWSYIGTIEIQYAPFSSNTTSILQQSPTSDAYDLSASNIRKIDNQITSERLGVFYLGQGNMASQNTAEVDLSGTEVIMRSAVETIAGGQLFRLADGTLSDVTVDDAFSNYNGLGRNVRLRYDTPSFSGFSLRASFGRDLLYLNSDEAEEEAVRDQDLYDVALAYAFTSSEVELQAQIAYGYKASYSVGGVLTPSTEILDGSASVLHAPTGLSLTVAAGQQDNGKFTGSYGYVKAGWQADLIRWGKTAIAVDHYNGSAINGEGTDSESTGLSIVQNITDWNTELWAAYRTYAYAAPGTDYDDSNAVFIGARFQF